MARLRGKSDLLPSGVLALQGDITKTILCQLDQYIVPLLLYFYLSLSERSRVHHKVDREGTKGHLAGIVGDRMR